MGLDEREAIQRPRPADASAWPCWRSSWPASSLHAVLHLEPSIVALLGAGVLVLISPAATPGRTSSSVEWPTLVFFAGLFVMVGGLVKTGVIGAIAHAGAAVGDRGPPLLTVLLLLVGSGGAVRRSSTTSPTSPPWPRSSPSSSTNGARHGHAQRCGGRSRSAPTSAATPPPSAPAPTSSSLGIAARHGHPISFWPFTRYGLVITAVTIAIAAPTSGCATSLSRDCKNDTTVSLRSWR